MVADVSWWVLLRSAPSRAVQAALVCTGVAAALVVGALVATGKSGGVPAALVIFAAAGLVFYAGAKTSGLRRAWALRRMLRNADGRLIDLVGYLEPQQLVTTFHARGYVTGSVRVHDTPGEAVEAFAQRQQLPSWWQAASPAARSVYFDGFAVRRDSGARPSGVLLEAAVECDWLGSQLVGVPVRVLGDESCALLFASGRVIWPRGRWLPGG